MTQFKDQVVVGGTNSPHVAEFVQSLGTVKFRYADDQAPFDAFVFKTGVGSVMNNRTINKEIQGIGNPYLEADTIKHKTIVLPENVKVITLPQAEEFGDLIKRNID
jgi:hypothetical protein